MAVNDDPRYLRVRQQLTEAILKLSAEKPADQITVSELTREAGVSRTTFYKHGASPVEYLADVLIGQIEPYLAEFNEVLASADEDYLLRWRGVYIAMLCRIREDRALLSALMQGEEQSVLFGLLTSKLNAIFTDYVQEFRNHLVHGAVSDLWVEMAVSQQVYNLISVLEAWLRTGMDSTPEQVVNTYLSLAPPWQLARFSSDGLTSLRRTRAVANMVSTGIKSATN